MALRRFRGRSRPCVSPAAGPAAARRCSGRPRRGGGVRAAARSRSPSSGRDRRRSSRPPRSPPARRRGPPAASSRAPSRVARTPGARPRSQERRGFGEDRRRRPSSTGLPGPLHLQRGGGDVEEAEAVVEQARDLRPSRAAARAAPRARRGRVAAGTTIAQTQPITPNAASSAGTTATASAAIA